MTKIDDVNSPFLSFLSYNNTTKSIGDVITPTMRIPFKRRPRNYSLVHRQEKAWERIFEAHKAPWGEWRRGRAASFLTWSFPWPLALTFPCCKRCLGASQPVSQNLVRLASNCCSSRHELLPLWIRKKFNERRHEIERQRIVWNVLPKSK